MSARTLVLDEADHMLDLGFIKDIDSIKRKLTQRHQTLFFSATINKTIKKLAYSQIRSNALRIQISPENRVSKNVSHFVTKVDMDDKRHLLVNILKDQPDTKCILFTRTQVRVERVSKHLLKAGFEPLSLHGGMDQAERERNLEKFRGQDGGLLIATDVSARGIDLPGINLVINYDLPEDPEYYVHRVGRTGRAFDYGEALSFCSPEETEKLHKIEEFIGAKIEVAETHASALVDKSGLTPKKINFAELIKQEEEIYQKKQKKKKKKKNTKSKR
jgi:ATP-dependent RNA helicase RhlE